MSPEGIKIELLRVRRKNPKNLTFGLTRIGKQFFENEIMLHGIIQNNNKSKRAET